MGDPGVLALPTILASVNLDLVGSLSVVLMMTMVDILCLQGVYEISNNIQVSTPGPDDRVISDS